MVGPGGSQLRCARASWGGRGRVGLRRGRRGRGCARTHGPPSLPPTHPTPAPLAAVQGLIMLTIALTFNYEREAENAVKRFAVRTASGALGEPLLSGP